MPGRSSKSILFLNGLTDSENGSEIENVDNFTLKRKRRYICVCSTSDSEVENNEGDNKDYCDSWTTNTFIPKIHPFTAENTGILANISRSAEIIDYFELFASDEFVQYIVNETNDYWLKKNNNNMKDGEATTLSEIYRFFAVSFLMTRNKKLSLAEYWSVDKLLRSDIFGEIMPRDRYFKLLSMLHFSHDIRSTNDKLYKIRNVVDMLRNNFSQSFYPYRDLCIDESLLLYKGRLSFKQYIPSKRSRFGIKSFILCDCRTGFVQDLIIYAGSSTISNSQNKKIGKSGAIVETLMAPYLGKGHTVFLDNWYSSPSLFNLLYDNYTNACGTVTKRRRGMPKITDILRKGEASSRSTKNLLAIKWMDKKEVYMLSTMHTSEFATVVRRGGKKIQKPVCVLDYNNCMGSVDKVDMVISTINSTRKSMKWYRKYFFHLLDICVWNAYCLYKHNTQQPISIAEFQLELIRQILQKYHMNTTSHHQRGNNNPLRLIERHFPSLYKPPSKNRNRRCVVCTANDKRRETRYECKDCNVGLCVEPCFRIYHTELYY